MQDHDGSRLRKIKSYTFNANRADVYYNPSYEEFAVHYFENGQHQPNATYFTADKDDAINTAVDMVYPDETC
jgi:hypothetical protein